MESMKLLSMTARNIKSVREVHLVFDGHVHEIRGDASAGKSAILEAISGGLTGLAPGSVRAGSDAAEILLELSEATVRRITHPDGKEELLVKNKAGQPVEKAKGFLEAIYGKATFDPVAWVNLGRDIGQGTTENRRAQRDQLVAALPLRLTAADVVAAVRDLGAEYLSVLEDVDLDGVEYDQHALAVCGALHKRVYEHRRKEVNPAYELAELRMKEFTPPEKAPLGATIDEARTAAQAARDEYHHAKARNEDRGTLVARVESLRKAVAAEDAALPALSAAEAGLAKRQGQARDLTAMVGTLEGEIAELERSLSAKRAELTAAQGSLREARDAIPKYEDVLSRHETQAGRKAELSQLEAEMAGAGLSVDLEGLHRAMTYAETNVGAWESKLAYEAAAAKVERLGSQQGRFNAVVRLLRDGMLNALMSRTDLPVAGLSLNENEVLVDGTPLWALGTSEQYAVGIRLGAALHRHLGFMLIDRAESIGPAYLKTIYEAARDLDVLLVLTFMDPAAVPGPGVTVMRDGAAVEGGL